MNICQTIIIITIRTASDIYDVLGNRLKFLLNLHIESSKSWQVMYGRMAPNGVCFLVFMALCNPIPRVWARPGYSLLMER